MSAPADATVESVECRPGDQVADGTVVVRFAKSGGMTLHIIKLCVGVESLEDLARLAEASASPRQKKKKKPLVLQHVTRMTPKRADEVLDGGSLYWVIKGQIAVRQKLLDAQAGAEGTASRIARWSMSPSSSRCSAAHHRPFQGWRYFDPKDAPPDVRGIKGRGNLPEKLQAELVELGLL